MMATIVVAGALANKPDNGGDFWCRLSWILGLRQLGFDVHFVEHIDPRCCVDEAGKPAPFEHSVNLAYFREIVRQWHIEDASTLICGNDEASEGLRPTGLRSILNEAELLLDISGNLARWSGLGAARKRAYLDVDPGFTQFWYSQNRSSVPLERYNLHFTIGENIGDPSCLIPTSGIRWRHTRHPVVMSQWPATPAERNGVFSTIAAWRGSFGPVYHEGKTFGLKVHEFRKLMTLPQRVNAVFELALSIHPADAKDRAALLEHGWTLRDPSSVARDPQQFRHYLQQAWAEFSPAQGVYVDTNSGWFSDRTARYLASGKPVLVQDTGFSMHIRTGKGLLAFRTLNEAVAGANEILRNHDEHAAAARTIAERYFASDVVIPRLLRDAGVSMPAEVGA